MLAPFFNLQPKVWQKNGRKFKGRDSLVSVLVLDSQPVVNSFLTNSFVIEPAIEREGANHYYD